MLHFLRRNKLSLLNEDLDDVRTLSTTAHYLAAVVAQLLL